MVPSDSHLYIDASVKGWGASLLQESTSGIWTTYERFLHINILEFQAICLGLLHFAGILQGSWCVLGQCHNTIISGQEKGHDFENIQYRSSKDLRMGIGKHCQDLHSVCQGDLQCVSELPQQTIRSFRQSGHAIFCGSQNFRLPNFVSPFWDPRSITFHIAWTCYDSHMPTGFIRLYSYFICMEIIKYFLYHRGYSSGVMQFLIKSKWHSTINELSSQMEQV